MDDIRERKRIPEDVIDRARGQIANVIIDAGVEIKKRGNEFIGLCPFHNEKTPSFHVTPARKTYHCYGCGAHGDAIDFLQHYYGLRFPDAIRVLAGEIKPTVGPIEQTKREEPPDIYADFKPVMPVPDNAPRFRPGITGSGIVNPKRLDDPEYKGPWRPTPTLVHPYRDAAGRILGYVLRINLGERDSSGKVRKITPQVTWCEWSEGAAWAFRTFPTPRPMYGLDRLAKMPDAPVILVEGEKAADAGQSLFPDCVLVTWPGGSNGIKYVDWSPLSGRRVAFLPDFDQPGFKAMNEIADQISDSAAKMIAMDPIDLPGGDGRDLADALSEKWSPAKARDWARDALRSMDWLANWTADDRVESIPKSISESLPTQEMPPSPDDRTYLDPTPSLWNRLGEETEDDDYSVGKELSTLEQSDTGNALRLLRHFGKDMVFIPAMGWHVYDGARWTEDTGNAAVTTMAQRTAKRIFHEVRFQADDDDRKKRAKHAVSSQNTNKIKGMITMAAPHIQVSADDLDGDPHKFNALNGTIDLRTGKLFSHDRHDLITKMVPIEYDPQARCPTWERMIADVFDHNHHILGYFQRAIGYSLTGLTSEQCLFIQHGSGSNGKSTIQTVMTWLTGDYHRNTPPSTFLAKKNEGGIPNDVARLKGARLVTASETEKDKSINESLIKQVTGGDTITARFLNKEFFDFRPQFKLWMATNHKPKIEGQDPAIWRRVHLIPYLVKFVKAADHGGDKDPRPLADDKLMGKLMIERPGILAWAVRGCKEWIENGLNPPGDVLDATKAYRNEQDLLFDFVNECCIVGPENSCTAKNLWMAYSIYCASVGTEAVTKRYFFNLIKERDGVKRQSERFFYGIGLNDASFELVNKYYQDDNPQWGRGLYD